MAQALAKCAAGLAPSHVLPIVLVLALALGLGIGVAASSLRSGDQVTIGNSAGTLSAVVAIDRKLIVVGGGDARSGLTDLVDRSTLPWQRHVHLLIIPGDRRYATGAIGLVERGGVGTVLVVGLPANDPIWDILGGTAAAHGTELRYVEQASRVQLSPTSEITVAAATGGKNGSAIASSIVIRDDQLRLLLVDVPAGVSTLRGLGLDGGTEPTALITLRPGAQPAGVQPYLLVGPEPQRASEAAPTTSRYRASLASGARLTLRLSPNELRVPLDRLTAMPASSPTPAIP